jgi:hypothetical protein
VHNFEGFGKPIDLKCNSAGNNSWKAHIQYSSEGKLAGDTGEMMEMLLDSPN